MKFEIMFFKYEVLLIFFFNIIKLKLFMVIREIILRFIKVKFFFNFVLILIGSY